jgi:hypothetical protein
MAAICDLPWNRADYTRKIHVRALAGLESTFPAERLRQCRPRREPGEYFSIRMAGRYFFRAPSSHDAIDRHPAGSPDRWGPDTRGTVPGVRVNRCELSGRARRGLVLIEPHRFSGRRAFREPAKCPLGCFSNQRWQPLRVPRRRLNLTVIRPRSCERFTSSKPV